MIKIVISSSVLLLFFIPSIFGSSSSSSSSSAPITGKKRTAVKTEEDWVQVKPEDSTEEAEPQLPEPPPLERVAELPSSSNGLDEAQAAFQWMKKKRSKGHQGPLHETATSFRANVAESNIKGDDFVGQDLLSQITRYNVAARHVNEATRLTEQENERISYYVLPRSAKLKKLAEAATVLAQQLDAYHDAFGGAFKEDQRNEDWCYLMATSEMARRHVNRRWKNNETEVVANAAAATAIIARALSIIDGHEFGNEEHLRRQDPEISQVLKLIQEQRAQEEGLNNCPDVIELERTTEQYLAAIRRKIAALPSNNVPPPIIAWQPKPTQRIL